ncbi:uncharacterized protein PHACADRAFT_195903 [Phanerochaete carnosa HHB-10118-sp]|uniref:Cytochrome P450 n=1 Tax=Phanerochaete carnosa (strain HHB-10118-sp) TaxID=650164 RepID=K5V078_PHACS|nr:uncharacterized protein PHACADRAFT_195903 [Phanerochaete carnosa HHB-10118-sp]EKM55851.1 hypothetical protein PHACADRAFT_195903 [Phanerochaete carnosa HHB-10118-sp]
MLHGSSQFAICPHGHPAPNFKRDAAEWYNTVSVMFDASYSYVEQSLAAGNANTSIVASLLQNLDDNDNQPEEEVIIREAFGAAYSAGVDTTYSSINIFILAMLKFPDVQRKAQQELDRIVGLGRLPDFEDRGSLPYITAVLRETLCWVPIAPLAAPHRLTVNNVYEGFHFPAGSLFIGNAWAILHDETRYPNPEAFVPERFPTPEGELDSNAPDPREACFGYGKRMCPERHFALESVWIAIASLLAVYNIEKAVDELGRVVEPSGEYISGALWYVTRISESSCSVVSYPLPFDASFKPRHVNATALIQ